MLATTAPAESTAPRCRKRRRSSVRTSVEPQDRDRANAEYPSALTKPLETIDVRHDLIAHGSTKLRQVFANVVQVTRRESESSFAVNHVRSVRRRIAPYS